VENARSMVMSPSGVLYIGNRNGDKVYAVKDTDGDFKADKKWVIASGLNMPNGVAFKDGDLYVAEVSRILKYSDIESKLANPPAPQIINDKYPTDTHHGWKYIAFGPDGKLYVPVGAPCNICESKDEVYASITRINPDGSGREIFASGVRNTVGFTWHPVTKELWFTDNGRDWLGNDIPPCELNRAPKSGLHFGYPYCHGGTIKDPEFGSKRPCGDFVIPAQNLGPHTAPLGIKFYTGNMFPAMYKNQAFIAEHGSWNRDKRIGYRVSMVKVENNTKAISYETFASGWLDDETQKVWGRPVDVLVLNDGSMLVSDDQADVVYRITYKP
jgi:glucose/arabinose dehydrogenase